MYPCPSNNKWTLCEVSQLPSFSCTKCFVIQISCHIYKYVYILLEIYYFTAYLVFFKAMQLSQWWIFSTVYSPICRLLHSCVHCHWCLLYKMYWLHAQCLCKCCNNWCRVHYPWSEPLTNDHVRVACNAGKMGTVWVSSVKWRFGIEKGISYNWSYGAHILFLVGPFSVIIV